MKLQFCLFHCRHHELVNRYGFSVSQITMDTLINIPLFFPHWWLITSFVTIATRRMPLMEPEQFTLPENICSLTDLSVVRVTKSLVFCVVFWRSLFFLFSVGNGFVCPFSIYLRNSDFLCGIVKHFLTKYDQKNKRKDFFCTLRLSINNKTVVMTNYSLKHLLSNLIWLYFIYLNDYHLNLNCRRTRDHW